MTGLTIHGFRLEQELGQGGMGVVYKGVNDTLGQEVAVKVLDPILAKNAEVRERFVQEARIQIGLRHPAIVQVLTAQVDQEPLALVMEYVDGLSLSEVLERRGALPLDEALRIMSQVLDAVGYAHSRGVIHRDLKPSNIMVTADGRAKVMDFGIAKVVGSAKLTRTGTSMGSPHYMSPEQVLGRKDVDHRTDIYSLGATLFEMLTGSTPFEDVGAADTDSDFLIKQAHVGRPAPDPRTLNSAVPASVARAVTRALEKDPDKRFQGGDAFVVALSMDDAQRSSAAASVIGTGYGRGANVQVPMAGNLKPLEHKGDGRDYALAQEVKRHLRFVSIPAGSFLMGSPRGESGRYRDEYQHEVHLTSPFQMMTVPVTQELWFLVMRTRPSHFRGDDLPVENVSWNSVQTFLERLKKILGDPGLRLPTEAQWEYAARAGTTEARYGPVDEIAWHGGWFGGNSGHRTHLVGQKTPNRWGLFDMLGNVLEWCQDWYGEYARGAQQDPQGPPSGSHRVVRGGSFADDSDWARAALRIQRQPQVGDHAVGFRIIR